MIHKIGFFSRLFHAYCVIALMCGCSRLPAQQSAPPKFPDRHFLDAAFEVRLQHADMPQIVQKLSEVTHLSMVVDGEPNRNLADFQFKAPARDLLERLAATFDYDWTLTRSNVVLFRKKFTVRGERPQTHLKEMQQVMKDIVAAFNLAPRVEREDALTPIIRQLAQSFTPEQTTFLKQGNKMSAGALSADQLSILNSAILVNTFAELEEKVDHYAALLSGMDSSYLVVKESADVAQASRPGRRYILVVRDKNKRLLSHYFVTWSGGD